MIVHYASQVVSPAVPQIPLAQAFLKIGTHLCG
ncbi:amide hydrolase [Streptomyces alboflavus]|uniref:Amide hydrolase n=1 Tax=Streptomyces alboflavus TaxID=67267 RepID=A0A1Z1WPE2_9ACTN|nr:amide hydrolase [Streptomyces alboflavus]